MFYRLKHLSIRNKVVFLLGLSASAVMVITAWILITIQNLNRSSEVFMEAYQYVVDYNVQSYQQSKQLSDYIRLYFSTTSAQHHQQLMAMLASIDQNADLMVKRLEHHSATGEVYFYTSIVEKYRIVQTITQKLNQELNEISSTNHDANILIKNTYDDLSELMEANGKVLADSEVVITEYFTWRTKEAKKISIVSGISFFIIAGINLLFFRTMGHFLIRPLEKLKQVAAAYGRGKFDMRVNVQSRDEMGSVATAFNTMAQQLQGLYQDLEQQVRERTKELDETNRSLTKRLDFEELIALASTRFVNMTDINMAIRDTLADLGIISEATEAAVYLFNESRGCFVVAHYWTKNPVLSDMEKWGELSLTPFKIWQQKFHDQQVYQINNVVRHEGDVAPEVDILRQMNIKAMIAIPFLVQGNPAGFVDIADHEKAREWGNRDIAMLKTIADMIGSALTRKIVEQQLKDNEAMFRMTTLAVKEGITLSDEKGKFSIFNDEMSQLTGYSMDEANAVGDFYKLLHPYDTQRKEIGSVLNYQIGERYLSETKIKTKAGEDKYLQVSTAVIEHQGKRMFLSAYSDITQLKLTEDALIEEKAGVEEKVVERTTQLKQETKKTNAILHSIGDGVFVLDENRKIILVNKVTEEISGFTQNELVGSVYNHNLKFILERNNQENTGFIDLVYEQGTMSAMTNHTQLIRKDGTKVAVADSAAPLKNDAGEVVGCVVVFRDVTKEREVEKMKDEFISIASHQLRTPLTAIRWSAEILEGQMKGSSNEEQSTLVSDIRESTKRLIGLVNNLLNITRIESGRIMINPEETDTGDLVKDVTEEVKVRFADKRQQYKVNIATDLPKINIDKKLIRQAVQNLLVNACKYSPDSSTICLSVTQNSSWITIEMKDEGYGIPQEAQQKLFQKFFRASNILQKDSDGSGLGLYLVEKIMEASGGRIRFQSQVDQGSTFWLDLPLSGSEKKQGEVQLS